MAAWGSIVGDVCGKGDACGHGDGEHAQRAACPSPKGGIAPGEVLEQANEILFPDIPPNMFVTCFYGVLDCRTPAVRQCRPRPALHTAVTVTLRNSGLEGCLWG